MPTASDAVPLRLAAGVILFAELLMRSAGVRAEELPPTEETTLVYVRASESDVDVWVEGGQFDDGSGDDWVYPALSPCTAPCLLRLPDGRYDLSVGHVDFSTRATGGLQVWDVEPTADWLLGLAIGMDVVGGLMVCSLLVNALVVFVSALGRDATGMSRDTMIGVGVSGGALLLGSIPAWVFYGSTGSSALTLEDRGFDLGGRVVLEPGVAVLPWEGDTPAVALSLSGSWRHFRAPHERRPTSGSPEH